MPASTISKRSNNKNPTIRSSLVLFGLDSKSPGRNHLLERFIYGLQTFSFLQFFDLFLCIVEHPLFKVFYRLFQVDKHLFLQSKTTESDDLVHGWSNLQIIHHLLGGCQPLNQELAWHPISHKK
jgi:hypothetical protein